MGRWVGWVGLAVVLAASPADAAGFTQPDGGLYIKIWDRTLLGSSAILSDGSRGDTGETYQDHALNFYLEYGLSDEWTFLTTGRPLGWASFGGESAVYVGELQVGLRRALLRGPVNVVGEVRYGYSPDVGTDVLGSGTADGETFNYVPTVETHSADLNLGLGTSFPWGWYSLTAGLKLLSEVALDHVVYANTSIAYAFAFGLVLELYFAMHQPLGDVVMTNVSGAGQTRFFGFGLDATYWLTNHWSVSLGVGGVAYAESNAATPALQLGVAFLD